MILILLLLGILNLTGSQARVVQGIYTLLNNQTGNLNASLLLPELARRADNDPADFGWIKRWAAVGDSFTAGIGSGSPLGSRFYSQEDWQCSRYDRSYAMVLNRAFGKAVEDFQFVACSGDRTEQIYDQVQAMQGNLNLVVMTAGGNDLCLADMIKSCVFMASSEEDCAAVIDKAQENIDNILKPNIKQVLQALNEKMADDAIVIYNGYAQFFNTENNDCNNKQDWTLFPILGEALPLTIARRKTFNDLVVQINKLIKDTVSEVADDSDFKYKIAFSNWDNWPPAKGGQMCDPSSTGAYPDPKQPALQFFKPNTNPDDKFISDPDRRRNLARQPQVAERDRSSLYDSLLYKSRNPAAVALHRLDPRAPSPPKCPGDSSSVSISVEDDVGKNFHPNELGHVTIASFAAATLMDARAQVLGVKAPSCEVVDKFTCWQSTGRRSYASADSLDANIKNFCEKDMRVHYMGAQQGWVGSTTYHAGTPDEQVFAARLTGIDSVRDVDQDALRDECTESLKRIIHGCDGNDKANPMNWKFGGQWRKGDNTWEATALATRAWPPVTEPDGSCEGWYHGFWSSYEMYGKGWATNDHGQQKLLPAIEDCAGESTLWKFKYLDPPTDEGYEWKATFDELIWVRARCFKNNKVVSRAGGFTDGCGGND